MGLERIFNFWVHGLLSLSRVGRKSLGSPCFINVTWRSSVFTVFSCLFMELRRKTRNLGRSSGPQENSPKHKTALGRWTQGTVGQSRVVANFPPQGPPDLRVTQPEGPGRCASWVSSTMSWGNIWARVSLFFGNLYSLGVRPL